MNNCRGRSDNLVDPSRSWLARVRWGAPRLRLAATGLAVALAIAGLYIPILSHLPDRIYSKDLVQEYLLARALTAGDDPYAPTTELASRYLGNIGVATFGLPHPTPHPPTAGLLFIPLSLLGYPAMAWIVFVSKLGLIGLGVYLIGRVDATRFSAGRALLLSLALMCWYPFSEDLWFGQVGVFIFCLLAGARLALFEGRFVIAGALIGVSLLVKPIAWPLLFLLVPRRRIVGLVWAVAVVAAGYLAVAAVAGPLMLQRYATDVLPLLAGYYRSFGLNTSLSSVGWRLFHGTGSSVQPWIVSPPVYLDDRLAIIVSILLPVLVLAVAVWLAVRRLNVDAGFVLLAAISAVASPISWGHYLVLALFAAVWVASWLVRNRWPVRETNWSILTAIVLLPSPYDWSGLVFSLAGVVKPTDGDAIVPLLPGMLTLGPLVGVIALAALVAVLGWREQRERSRLPCGAADTAIY